MKIRAMVLGLVGAAIGWLEPGGDSMVDLVNREGRRDAPADPAIVGSPHSGYRSEGDRFYTWQPERADVVAWVEELAPWDHPPRTAPRE